MWIVVLRDVLQCVSCSVTFGVTTRLAWSCQEPVLYGVLNVHCSVTPSTRPAWMPRANTTCCGTVCVTVLPPVLDRLEDAQSQYYMLGYIFPSGVSLATVILVFLTGVSPMSH